ncbi:basic proline-rich protein-like [Hippopotamus amphibius kiboko]|uniref:basic proline-rich protein-like n=1 Tax=Hippopotamus amphibius kiboko TaxID=575201 RepID=UPI002598C8E1|nr:basic proline-rich protein-like [Hippopotamus amphibius kiboko]
MSAAAPPSSGPSGLSSRLPGRGLRSQAGWPGSRLTTITDPNPRARPSPRGRKRPGDGRTSRQPLACPRLRLYGRPHSRCPSHGRAALCRPPGLASPSAQEAPPSQRHVRRGGGGLVGPSPGHKGRCGPQAVRAELNELQDTARRPSGQAERLGVETPTRPLPQLRSHLGARQEEPGKGPSLGEITETPTEPEAPGQLGSAALSLGPRPLRDTGPQQTHRPRPGASPRDAPVQALSSPRPTRPLTAAPAACHAGPPGPSLLQLRARVHTQRARAAPGLQSHAVAACELNVTPGRPGPPARPTAVSTEVHGLPCYRRPEPEHTAAAGPGHRPLQPDSPQEPPQARTYGTAPQSWNPYHSHLAIRLLPPPLLCIRFPKSQPVHKNTCPRRQLYRLLTLRGTRSPPCSRSERGDSFRGADLHPSERARDTWTWPSLCPPCGVDVQAPAVCHTRCWGDCSIAAPDVVNRPGPQGTTQPQVAEVWDTGTPPGPMVQPGPGREQPALPPGAPAPRTAAVRGPAPGCARLPPARRPPPRRPRASSPPARDSVPPRARTGAAGRGQRGTSSHARGPGRRGRPSEPHAGQEAPPRPPRRSRTFPCGARADFQFPAPRNPLTPARGAVPASRPASRRRAPLRPRPSTPTPTPGPRPRPRPRPRPHRPDSPTVCARPELPARRPPPPPPPPPRPRARRMDWRGDLPGEHRKPRRAPTGQPSPRPLLRARPPDGPTQKPTKCRQRATEGADWPAFFPAPRPALGRTATRAYRKRAGRRCGRRLGGAAALGYLSRAGRALDSRPALAWVGFWRPRAEGRLQAVGPAAAPGAELRPGARPTRPEAHGRRLLERRRRSPPERGPRPPPRPPRRQREPGRHGSQTPGGGAVGRRSSVCRKREALRGASPCSGPTAPGHRRPGASEVTRTVQGRRERDPAGREAARRQRGAQSRPGHTARVSTWFGLGIARSQTPPPRDAAARPRGLRYRLRELRGGAATHGSVTRQALGCVGPWRAAAPSASGSSGGSARALCRQHPGLPPRQAPSTSPPGGGGLAPPPHFDPRTVRCLCSRSDPESDRLAEVRSSVSARLRVALGGLPAPHHSRHFPPHHCTLCHGAFTCPGPCILQPNWDV